MQHSQLARWLALSFMPGVGPRKFQAYLARDPNLTHSVRWSKPLATKVAQQLTWAEAPEQHLVPLYSAHYPPLLKTLAAPPPILYVKGQLQALSLPQVAMVGSRNCTELGRRVAAQLAGELAERGFCITSGLAIGIDAACHRGALAKACPTVAVLGHGLDTLYPRCHRRLAEDIAGCGAQVSEYPLGTPVRRGQFPARNRIISGLSLGVVVVEAAVSSGSLLTAKAAAEQGREVFAVPGLVTNQAAHGCHALIQQGAKLVQTSADVVEELGSLLKYVIHDKIPTECPSVHAAVPSQPELVQLMGYLMPHITPVDELVKRSGLSAGRVAAMLLQLELEGYVNSVPGGYIRALG